RAGSFTEEEGESTAVVRERVWGARQAAQERWRDHGFATNAEVSGSLLRRKFRPSAEAMKPLRMAVDRGAVSIRGMDRAVRVAWTLADLAGRTSPNTEDVMTAMSFRQVVGH
ncbi:MAG: ATP-binding protein, partial [Dietzia sp.]|nr:ATP-binding protein [Dietzia sp.]